MLSQMEKQVSALTGLGTVGSGEALIERGILIDVDADEDQHDGTAQRDAAERGHHRGINRAEDLVESSEAAHAVERTGEDKSDRYDHQEEEDHIGDGDAEQAANAGKADGNGNDDGRGEELVHVPRSNADIAAGADLRDGEAGRQQDDRADKGSNAAVETVEQLGHRGVDLDGNAGSNPQSQRETHKVRADGPDKECGKAHGGNIADRTDRTVAAVPGCSDRTDRERPRQSLVCVIVGFHISVLLAHEDADGEDADHAQDNCNIVNQCKHFLLLLFRCREGSAFLPAKFERGAYFCVFLTAKFVAFPAMTTL